MAARSALALVCIALIAVSHVRASCTWSVTNPQFATIAAGLAFSTDTVGWSPVSDNGSGSFVLTTSDGGKTWNQYAAPSGVLLFLGAAESGSAAVASDTFGLDFSLNAAKSFNTSIVPNGITSQNVMAFRNDPDSFGAAGQSLFGQNGAAVSNDAGLSFTWSNISILSTQARYGAYPSAKTWFISAGQWPNNAEEDSSRTTISELSARLSVSMSEVDGKMSVKAFPPRQRVAADNSTGWAAQIVKTTDGGQTWTSLFSSTSFYFNQIDCYSETHCAAVGEADTSDKPGIRIHVTFDGQTWTETYFNPDPNESIFALNFISDNEIWAAGGLLSSTAFTGKFYHSTDGGKSWTIDEVPDVYGNAMSFPTAGSGNVGYATAFNAESISSFLTCA